MTAEELEALWALEPRTPRRPGGRWSSPLLFIMALAGCGPVRASTIEHARFELQVLYDGDAIDFGEYMRQLIEIDEIAHQPDDDGQ